MREGNTARKPQKASCYISVYVTEKYLGHKKKLEELTLSNKNHTRKNWSKKKNQQLVLGKLDIYTQKNEIKPLPHITHKN